MSLNLVIPNKDNLVVYVFGGIDLTLATDIQVQFGSESYSLINDPTIVKITSSTELSLDLSATNEVGKIFSTVTYFDGASVNGTDITSRELGNSDQIVVAIGSQLIIEDGSIVANANSLTTDEEFKTYANLRGFSVPSTEPARDALQILAMDYLFSIEGEIKGRRTNDLQELPLPRIGMCGRDRMIKPNEIPKDWKRAQMELAIQAQDSDLLVNASIQNIASEKLGDLQVDYFSGGSWASVQTQRADAYLNPFLKSGNGVTLVRV